MNCPLGLTGYGIAGYNITQSLIEQGVEVSLFPIGTECARGVKTDLLKQAVKNAETFDKQAPSLKIWHQFQLAERVGVGPHLSFPFFELDPLSWLDVHHLNTCDKIFLASDWAKQVALRSGVTSQIEVVPLGIDPEIFYPRENPSGPCVFINIGKWEKRKGHKFLGDIFNSVFSTEDDVELWLMPNMWQLKLEEKRPWYELYLNTELGRAGMIKILDPVPTHNELAEIISYSSFGVFPALAEGWNLELLECMAMGKTCITTDYSAHTEFCNTDNSLLVHIEDTEPAKDDKWFDGKKGSWAKFGDTQKKELGQLMKFCYETWKSGGYRPNEKAIETGKKLTWSNTACSLIKNI